jgi:hypothetical protein
MIGSLAYRGLLRNLVFLLLAFGLAVHAQSLLKNPRWKVLVLIYDSVDFIFADPQGHQHHVVTSMTQAEKNVAEQAAKKFLEVDVPTLDSGNMSPLATIRFASHPLTQLAYTGGCDYGYWPDPAATVADRSPERFDSAIVIFQESGTDLNTGQHVYLGCWGGLTWPMGVGQTYASFIFRMFSTDQRNVFKHEWGHSILFYYNDSGAAPKPAVDNHISANRYVHCGTGTPYTLMDDSDTMPVPNSIYNNQAGFTHDYYSGTTATVDQPNRCIGITPATWATGGPLTHPIQHPGDLNGDGKVDVTDLMLLMKAQNSPAIAPNDPRDLDYDGQITILDGRILVTLCTKPYCVQW